MVLGGFLDFWKSKPKPLKSRKKIIKHHNVTSTPETLRKLAWNHLTVFWLRVSPQDLYPLVLLSQSQLKSYRDYTFLKPTGTPLNFEKNQRFLLVLHNPSPTKINKTKTWTRRQFLGQLWQFWGSWKTDLSTCKSYWTSSIDSCQLVLVNICSLDEVLIRGPEIFSLN